MFKEIKQISDAYVQYKNLGAFTVNPIPLDNPYLKMSNPVTDFKGLKEIKGNYYVPLLVGCFEKEDGYAFTVVNMTDLEYVQRAYVDFKLPDGYRAVSWQRGVRTELTPDKNGEYHLILASGEGVFVEVVKERMEGGNGATNGSGITHSPTGETKLAPRFANHLFNDDINRFWNNSVEKYCARV